MNGQRPGKRVRRFIERELSDVIADRLETLWLDNKITLQDKDWFYSYIKYVQLRPRKYVIVYPDPDILKAKIKLRLKHKKRFPLARLTRVEEGLETTEDRMKRLLAKLRKSSSAL